MDNREGQEKSTPPTLRDLLKVMADQEYSAYIDLMEKPICQGWEAKCKAGTFGDAELTAHTMAGTHLGHHQGLMRAIRIIDNQNSWRSVAGGEPTEQERELRKSLEDARREISLRNAEIMNLHRRVAGGEPEQWISVEERLPEFGGTYVVAVNGMGDDGEDYAATLPADWSVGDRRWYDLRGWGSNEVTHWRPLPAPPQGKEQK